VAGDYVFVGASAEDAAEILKLNSFTFFSQALEIVESNEGLGYQSKATESAETKELRGKLQAVLGARYLGENKLLKLDALAEDPDLRDLGAFSSPERALKTFKGLMAVCDGLFKTVKDKQDAIESISLANNNINDVSQVETVATTFTHLKNLDMSGNMISNMAGMERWKGKFKELETIYMTGNPIEASDPNYHTSFLEWFPKLQIINGTQLRTPEQIAAQAEARKPKPIPQRGPDFRDVNNIGEQFLLGFFTSYDNDRQGLATTMYDEASQFSLAVDTRSVRDTNAPAPMSWNSYIKTSRNLVKINSQNARFQRLFKGGNVILDLWNSLPATRHPDIKTETFKYIMDCHPVSGLVDPSGQNTMGSDGLIISVHGEFDEYDRKTDTTGKRSFSRTFLLGPGQPGRNALRVVSDMLSLRAYNALPNVHVPAEPQPVAPTEAPALAPNQQQAMVAELSKQTNMVPQYSQMCLEQVNWEFPAALIMFSEKKVRGSSRCFQSTC
jgi:nuclear RNA export factor